MGLTVADKGGGDFTPAPEGTHVARCVQVIDLGTQTSTYYTNNDGSFQKTHKVLFGWELPSELNEEGEPFLVFNRYTASLSTKANLRQHLESWRGRQFTEDELAGFELRKVLDVPCLINISHRKDGKATYADVKAVMALPKGQQPPPRHHKLIEFDLDRYREPAMQEVFATFSENLQKTIKSSAELSNAKAQPPSKEEDHQPPPADDFYDAPIPAHYDDEDEIPF